MSSSALPPTGERSYGLRNRRLLSGGTYGEIDLIKALESSSRNPLEHWTQAYIRFTASQGGAKIREVMNGIMTTTGVVAALIATLVVSCLLSPPLCQNSIFQSCTEKEGEFITYGAIHAFNLISCLATITYATIGLLWLGVHRDEEMNYFILEYYVYAIAVPATCMSFAICGTVAAELLRVYIIYSPIAFWFAIGTAIVVMIPCCWFATKIVFTTVALRKAHTLSCVKGGTPPTSTLHVETGMM